MKVLMVAPFVGFGAKYFQYFQVGGAEKSILALITELSKKVNEFYLLTSQVSDPVDLPNVVHLRLLSWKRAIVACKFVGYKDAIIKRVVDQINPDVIDSQEKYSAGLIAPQQLQIPIVQTLRDHWFACPQNTLLYAKNVEPCSGSALVKCAKCYLFLQKNVSSRSKQWFQNLQSPLLAASYKYAFPKIKNYLKTPQKILATSHTIKKSFIRHYPSQEFLEKTHVVGNPIQLELIQNPEPNRNPYFVWAGRFSPEKGIRHVLNAFFYYKKLGGRSTLVIAGTGALKPYIINVANQTKAIRYLGWIPQSELNRLLLQSRAFITLHLWDEPFGRTVASAIGAGTPVITSRFGEPGKMVRKSRCGFVTDPDDYETIAKLLLDIDHLASDSYERFYTLGQRFVKNNFSPIRIARNYLQVYQNILA